MSWSNVPIEKYARIVGGSTPSTSISEYWNGDICWATPKDLSELESHYIADTPRKITSRGLENCAAEILPPGSVLFSSRAPIGHVAVNQVPMATNQGFKSFVPNPDKLDSKFLFHWLRYKRPYLESLGNGATFKEVSKAVVARLEIPLPPFAEQRRIAAILDAADALRAKRRAVLAKIGSLAQSIFIEMFGVDGLAGNTTANDRLGAHLSFITSGGRGWAEFYANAGSRFIRSLDVQMNSIGSEDIVFVIPPQSAEAHRTEVRIGDVLLTITGSRIGRVAAVPNDLAGSYVSQHVAILRPKASLLSRFLSFYLSSKDGQRQIAKNQYGQTKPGLNFEQIKAFVIPIPPINVQQRFVARMDYIDTLEAYQRGHSAKLGSLFASLQHSAFRGEL